MRLAKEPVMYLMVHGRAIGAEELLPVLIKQGCLITLPTLCSLVRGHYSVRVTSAAQMSAIEAALRGRGITCQRSQTGL